MAKKRRASHKIPIGELIGKAVEIYYELRRRSIYADIILLFGSHAKGNPGSESDIDLAVVSRNFGSDPIEEGAICNLVATGINPRFEVVALSLDSYLDPDSYSPILAEIRQKAVCLI